MAFLKYPLIAALIGALPAFAAPSFDEASVCERQAAYHAEKAGIPDDILHGIVRTESSSYPWAINHKGKGFFFDTKEEAIEHAKSLQEKGTNNFDVGCAQINLRWHPEAFGSLEDAFDPDKNLEYAAEFLNTINSDYGVTSWFDTVAMYHTSNRDRGRKYAKVVFKRIKQAPVFSREVYNGYEENGGLDVDQSDLAGSDSADLYEMPLIDGKPAIQRASLGMEELRQMALYDMFSVSSAYMATKGYIDWEQAAEPHRAGPGRGKTSSLGGVIGNLSPRETSRTMDK